MIKNILFIYIFLFVNYITGCSQNASGAIDTPMDKCTLLNKDSIPILHSAVLNGDIKRVKCLLRKNVDIMSLDAQGETALMYACKSSITDFEIISLLLESGSDILYESPKTLNSAIFFCIKDSKTSVLQFLLNRLTPKEKELLKANKYYLHYSIVVGESEIVTQLIPYQGDLNGIYFREEPPLETAISYAVFRDNLKSIKYDWEEKETIDVEAAIEIISILLSNGALLNESPVFSYMVSRAMESPRVLSYLIKKGLALNKPVETYLGTFQLLDLFITHVTTREVFIFIEEEVDMTEVKTLESYLDLFDVMIEKGAKISPPNISPYQQLAIEAVNKNNLNLVALLLKREKMEVDFVDSEGKTLLMRAQELGFNEMVHLLK